MSFLTRVRVYLEPATSMSQVCLFFAWQMFYKCFQVSFYVWVMVITNTCKFLLSEIKGLEITAEILLLLIPLLLVEPW